MSGNSKGLIVIGISDLRISRAPDLLVTYALGSCVGTMLYDEYSRVGGLAHIMLPDSRQIKHEGSVNRMKFADTALIDLLEQMERLGAGRSHIRAKIVGGANMFKALNAAAPGSIGGKNVLSVKRVLSDLGIPIIGEDTGKDYGRTVFFELDTGDVHVQSLGRDMRTI